MKKTISIFAILLLAVFASSCKTNKIVDVKSPCVSTEDGPCGPKKSINDWWLKKNQKQHS